MFLRLLGSNGARAALGAALLFGCTNEVVTLDPRGGSSAQAIVDGEPSDERDDAVVMLRSSPPDTGEQACTGTLVAPNLVLTALHCVAYYTGGAFSCKSDGSLSTNIPGNGEIGAPADPAKIEVYSGVVPNEGEPVAYGAAVFGTGAPTICRNDFAAVVLDRALDLPIAPIRLERTVERAERMLVVGYGMTEEGTLGERRRRSGVLVSDVGPASDASPTGTAAPRTFVLTEGACFGDSGGPAFSEETGALTGVYSLAAGMSCTAPNVRNVYTRIAPFRDLILKAFEAAGAEPELEPPDPDPPDPPDPTDPDPIGGSGSREDPSCACRVAGGQRSGALAVLFAGLLGAAFAARRFARLRA